MVEAFFNLNNLYKDTPRPPLSREAALSYLAVPGWRGRTFLLAATGNEPPFGRSLWAKLVSWISSAWTVTYVFDGQERVVTLQARRLVGLLLNASLLAWIVCGSNMRRARPLLSQVVLLVHGLHFTVVEEAISTRCAALLVRPADFFWPWPFFAGKALITFMLPRSGFDRAAFVLLSVVRILLLPLLGSRLPSDNGGPMGWRWENEGILTAVHCALAIAVLPRRRAVTAPQRILQW